ncbi:MAG: PAS domain S-box protein [Nitrospinaceae bacterium]
MKSFGIVQDGYHDRWRSLLLKRQAGFYYIKNWQGDLVFVSPEVTQALGWEPAHVIRNWKAWMAPQTAEKDNKIPFHLKRRFPEMSLYVVKLPDKQGRLRIMELVEQLNAKGDGDEESSEGIATDVTETKQREWDYRARENRFREIIDFSPVGIFQTDGDDRYTYVNTRWQIITKFTLKDALGKTWWAMIHPEDQGPIFKEWADAQKESRECVIHARIMRPNGELRWVEIRSRFLFYDQGKSAFGTLEDITDRKLMEKQLAEYAEELKRSNHDLEDFAAIASHDLQEPLRKILTFGDRLISSFETQDRERALDYVARIQKAGSRMQSFIQDLLQFSRLSTKAHAFTLMDMGKLVREVVMDLEVRITKSQGEVKVGNLPTLEVDEFQMRQLFQNLISNALKFHRPDVPPRVSVDSRSTTPGEWVISVKDNGVGFDEKYLDRIFKPFERLHGRNEFEGTGMGLAICKKILDRHGGSITAKSVPGEGTRFIMTLRDNF